MKRIFYARVLLLIMIFQVVSPLSSYALTGGPAQPEFQSFEPVSTTEMVNLPDGGFTYNIPLMDIGGYPLNLSYHSDISSEMEASCVGLGWSINPGVINRNIRALPDDFNGKDDQIKKEYNLKANSTIGASLAVSFEIYGIDAAHNTGLNIGMNMGMFINSYWGIGYEFGISPGLKAGKKGGSTLTAGLGMSVNSQSGANFSPSLSYSSKMDNVGRSLSASVGTSINSREGLKAINLSANASRSSVDNEGTKEESVISEGSSFNSSFNFAGNTFTPEFTMPQTNVSATVNIKPAGIALFGSNGAPSISGYFSTQFLRNKEENKPAYGMIYAHNGANKLNALMDFNREKDGAFRDYSINLPIVNPGFDILNVNGQGIGGSFELKRSDVPIFFDAKSIAEGGGGSLGFEFGSGNTAHGGVDINFNNTSSYSKKWTSGNDVLSQYDFSSTGNEDYEPAYYKAAGEMAIESDIQFYKKIGEDLAVRADLVTPGLDPFNVQSSQTLKNKSGADVGNPNSTASLTKRIKRERRNQVISYLTAEEASKVGLEKQIRSYKLNDFQSTSIPLPRKDVHRKAHHISQIESTQPDGLRYIYGIPAYNLTQKEVSFSVDPPTNNDCSKGVVSYTKGIDNVNTNTRGQENYFNSVETPAFAHSYLLTTVLGKDYEDLTGNGPTIDDFGSYTKINYSKVKVNNDSIYHWRVPFGKENANYNPGFYSKTHDDKGTYVYGQKEIWLVHSIESKTMVAEFAYQDRLDGFGVIDENGGREPSYNLNKKLYKITLYSKPDRVKNLTSATPIKTVYFNYNYSLCPYTDNSVAPAQTNIAPKGKLTLTGIYFTFGNSMKGKLSDYKFAYRHQGLLQGQPYKYGSKDFDRWGNYMPSMYNSNCTNPHLGDPVSNDEFPYAEQDSAKANLYAGTWSLNQIELPSGGTIKINYKAKHYAYVQDQPAMRLMDITGIKANGGTDLYGLPLSNYLKVYFKLENPAATRDELKRDYLRNIRLNEDYIYLKCYVKMNSGPVSNDKWEYVSLYSQISDYDVGVGNEYGYGYVKLNPLPISDDILNPTDLNPITKFSLQYMRENLPEIAYDQIPATQDPSNPVISVFQPLASMASQLVQFVHGFNKVMIARGYAKKIELDRSYIRLYKPDGVKYGGGSMVTKIEIKDNWGTMTNTPSADFSYGQIYDYMTSETQSDGSEREISSGVASYEPIIGGDENPLRIADVISERRRFAIDNVHYVEKPYGEVFMPAPQVVFSKITVRNLQYNNVKRTATGHTVMEYYTAKDFPVKTSRTDLLKRPRRINPLLGLLKIKLKEHMNASQGYAIETNNMHGQAKSSKVYDENGTRISGVFYHYKTNSSGELDNNVDVIHPDGRVTKGLLGVNYSLAGDARESKTRTISGGIALNLDAYMVTPVPVVVPLPWPNFEQSEERFRSMSFTKLINKFGVLESIEAYDLGSTITTNNLAYDAETGEVLLTRTYNEFNDPIYNLKIPAHLAYKGMQGAYKNIGFEASSSGNISNGVCSFSNTPASTKFFMPGDEVLLNGPLNIITKKAWVLYVDLISDKIYLIDIDGVPVGMGQSNLKIIRSGYRNMPTTQIGSITSMKNPIQANGYLEPIQKTQVLQADATEYSEKWQAYCGENMDACLGKPYTNPYTHNLLGEWRPLKSWLYLTERDRSPIASTSSSTNIRDNGFYLNFSSFWNRPLVSSNPANPQANLWSKDETDWIWSATATKINPNGTELESQNRLGLFSAEIVGYYNQLVTGVASNSRHRQIAFEGFEDFAYNGTLSPNQSCDFFRHFGEGFLSDTTSQTNHTGKYALKVPGNTSISTSNDIEENCPPGNTTTPINLPMGPYYRDKCNCIQSFSPDPGKYVITAWVKEDNGLGYRYYSDHSLSVITNSFSQSFKAKGMIIDGWQRIEAEFVIGPTDTNIRIMLEALGTKPVYFDDIRIFPFDGNMKNYVYDDISLKLLAELDANGYAKFYEYNQAGELIRIKQETERGIMTIQESRSSMPK